MTPKYSDRCSSLYTNIKMKHRKTLLYNVVFLARRLAACVIIAFMAYYPIAQAQFMCLSAAAVVVYSASVLPFTGSSLNFLDVGNEITILAICYL